MQNIGCRASVMYGMAKKTSGGLTKDDLMYNDNGKIVSKKKNLRGGSGQALQGNTFNIVKYKLNREWIHTST